jgi:hypothetical protein
MDCFSTSGTEIGNSSKEGKAMFCIECGAPNPERAKFCNACGKCIVAPTPPPEPREAGMVCGSCKQENPADYRFCCWCGKALTNVEVNSEPTFEAKEPAVKGVTSLPEKEMRTRKCPFCAEEIAVDARKCKHCGEFVDATQSASAPFSGAPPDLLPYYQDEFQRIRESGEQYRGKWNWAAFCFGGFWALSKGLWKQLVIALVGSLFTWGIVGIIYCFVFGARGNYLYYCKVIKHQEWSQQPWI